MPILTPASSKDELGPTSWHGAGSRTELAVECLDSDGNVFYGLQVVYDMNGRKQYEIVDGSELRFSVIPLSGQYSTPQFHGTLTFRYLNRELLTIDLADADITEVSGTLAKLTVQLSRKAVGPYNSTPPADISGLQTVPMGDRMLLEWSSAGATASTTYLVRIAQQEEDLPHARPNQVYESRVLVEKLHRGLTYYAEVWEVNGAGAEGTSTVLSFGPEESDEVLGLITRPFRGVELGSDPYTIDLADHIYVSGDEGDDQATRWSAVSVDVETYGDTDVATYDLTGTTLTVTRNVLSTSPLVFSLRLRREGAQPCYAAFPVWYGDTTQTHEVCVNLQDAREFETAYAGATFNTSAPRRIAEPGVLCLNGTLHVNSSVLDGRPQIGVLVNEGSFKTVLLSGDPDGAQMQLPLLPDTAPKKAEALLKWTDVQFEDLLTTPHVTSRPALWRRVLTTDDKLYDVSFFSEPEEVYFAPPRYYGGHWYDRIKYPDDAILLINYVQYRGGLTTETAAPEAPRIEDLVAKPGPGVVDLSWTTLHPDEDTPVDLSVPVQLKLDGAGEARMTQATDHVRLRGLLPARTYQVDVLDASVNVMTEEIAPAFIVEASSIGESTYKYTYRLTAAGMTSWTDTFGDSHTDTDVSIESSEITERHHIIVTYADATTRTAEAWSQWTTRGGLSSFEESVYVGYTLPASALPEPLFRRAGHRGETERLLSYNIYAPGTWRAVIEGALPPGLNGELEDYADAVFVAADGRELSSVVTLTESTSLAIRLRVRAAKGLSPVIDGVRPVPQDLTS